MTLVRFTRFVLLQDGRNPAQLRTKGPKAEEEGRRLLADLERREDRPQTNARWDTFGEWNYEKVKRR